MKNLNIIILNTLIFFVLINVLIAFSWPYISDKRNTKHSYNEKVSNFLDLSEEEFEKIVNKHRNDEIWKSGLNNKWELINSI